MNDILQNFVAFSAGVLSFFSPCVLPLIPAYVCFITGLSSEELIAAPEGNLAKRKLILNEMILFILGFSLIFVALGASASFLGSYFIAHMRLVRIIGGIIVILFGLQMSGLLKIKFLAREKKFHLKHKPLSWLGSVFVGMAFGLAWTPCVSPILGGILVLAATKETLTRGVVLLSFYSLGLALFFLLIGIGIKWTLSLFTKVKRYFKVISLVSGILLIVVGITILLPAAWTEETVQSKDIAADFSLSTLEGETLQLSDFKGKIIILNFWAMFCPSCRQELPELVKLYQEYQEQGLAVIAINLDGGKNIDKVKAFAESININFPVVIGNRAVVKSYGGIKYIPASFIINREMKIVKELVGYTAYDDFATQVEELLEQTPE